MGLLVSGVQMVTLNPTPGLSSVEAQGDVSSFTPKVVGSAWEVAGSRTKADFSKTSVSLNKE